MSTKEGKTAAEGRKKPKAVPVISGEEDVRLQPATSPDGRTGEARAATVPEPAAKMAPRGYEPKNLGKHISIKRLNFAQWLIGSCVFLITVLALVGYFFPRESDLLSGAVDTLKLIVTTALGFVFARTLDRDK